MNSHCAKVRRAVDLRLNTPVHVRRPDAAGDEVRPLQTGTVERQDPNAPTASLETSLTSSLTGRVHRHRVRNESKLANSWEGPIHNL